MLAAAMRRPGRGMRSDRAAGGCVRGVLVLILALALALALALGAGACGSKPAPPAADGPAITISLVHDAAQAADLERDAVEPIEQAVASLAGVRSLRATIEPGRAHVVISFEASRPIDLAAAEVMRAVREVQRQLPTELAPPVISRVDLAGPALWLELSGTQPRATRSDLARDVVKVRLEQLPGVGAIELEGVMERRIAIRPDLARLAAADVTLGELAAAIRGARPPALPAGRRDPRATTLRVAPAPATLEGLGELVIATREGAPIRLRDLAAIEERTSGDPEGPLLAGVRLQQGADREAVLASVRAALVDLRRELPPGLTLAERGPPPSVRPPAPLAVSLRGPDRAVLRTIAAKLESDLEADSGVSEITRAPPPGSPEQSITLDRAAIARLGIAHADLAATVRAALGTYPLGTLYAGDRELSLVLRMDSSAPELLARVTVRATRGELVPLAVVATATTTSAEHLLRIDREPAIELSARIAPGAPLAAARRRLVELTRGLAPGYRAAISP